MHDIVSIDFDNADADEKKGVCLLGRFTPVLSHPNAFHLSAFGMLRYFVVIEKVVNWHFVRRFI